MIIIVNNMGLKAISCLDKKSVLRYTGNGRNELLNER